MRKIGYNVNVKEEEESEEPEDVCKNAGKKRKRFWSRWLNVVRGNCFGNGAIHPVKPKSMALHSLGTSSESNATSMDVIEIPMDPDRKISKILIKPTKTGIKAMIAQSRSRPLSPNRSFASGRRTPKTNKWPPSEDSSWKGSNLGQSETKLSNKCEQAREKSANWSTKIFKNGSQISGSKEALLTSALFIHEDMDNIVESAVFIEPNLANDYPLSRKSDDLSQKSVKINKRRVSYRIIDERNDEILKTIKTISEPTWMERENILRRRRLHDNINNLLEQFMFLETDDVVGLTFPRSRPSHDKKTIPFDNCSAQSFGGYQKEISREVSPEILINKKPFKEYLSHNYLITEDPSLGAKSQKSTESLALSGKKTKSSREKNDKAEEHTESILNEVLMSEEHDYRNVSNSGFGGGIRRITSVEREIRRTCYGDCEEVSEVAALRCVESEESPMCTIWGVCKTYSARSRPPKAVTPPRDHPPDDLPPEGPDKETLDELLNTLDDSNHDLVFQKNISQFRKKINVVPRFDLRNKSKITEVKKAKWPQSYLEMIKPIAEESKNEENDGGRRITGESRAEKWSEEAEPLRVFMSPFLAFVESNIVRTPLAYRTEEAVVTITPRVREIYTPLESSRFVIVERIKPETDKKLSEVHLICKKTVEVEKMDLKTCKTVSMVLGIRDENSSVSKANELVISKEDIPQSLPIFSNTTECFYVIQTSQYPNSQQLNGYDPKSSAGTTRGNRSEKDARGQTSSRSRGLNAANLSEPALESARSRLQSLRVLNTSAFDQVISLYGYEQYVETPVRRHSECVLHRDFFELASPPSFGSLTELEERGSYHVDSFQILYSKGVNDEDEETMKSDSVRSFCERPQNIIFAVEEVDSEEEVEEEEMKEVNSDKKGNTKIVEKKWSRFLKFKSSSSPKESIILRELKSQEYGTRRSMILLRDLEKDLQNSRKRRLSVDRGLEIRRRSAELHAPKLTQDEPLLQKKASWGKEKKLGGLRHLGKAETRPEGEKKKVLISEGSAANVRKEVMAAFNSIKELSAYKGEAKGGSKRMSLVIMLSKK